jgi:hypothetical protein
MLRSVSIGILLVAILLAVQYSAIECGQPAAKVIPPKEITLIISSNTTSHFTPCGCSTPMGGVLRRGTEFQNIRTEVTWPLLFIDSGNVSQGSTSESQTKKDDYIFQSYALMDYDVINVGYQDTRLGYAGLENYKNTYNIPWTSCNIFPAGTTFEQPATDAEAGSNPPENAEAPAPTPSFAPYTVTDYDGFKVACMGVVIKDATQLETIEGFSFKDYQKAIQDTVNQLRLVEKAGLIIAITDVDTFPENFDAAAVFQGVDIVIGTREPMQASPNATLNPDNPQYNPNASRNPNTPPNPNTPAGTATGSPETSQPDSETEAEVAIDYLPIPIPLTIPLAETQGKRINRVDIWLDSEGKPFDYTFTNIGLDPSIEDDVRMASIAEGYDRDVLIGELTDQVSMAFSGSQACEECHPGFLAAWADSPHFNTYQTIVDGDALNDRSCTACHAVGFYHKPRLILYESIPEVYKNVGCEGCHENGQSHINFVNYENSLPPERQSESTRTDPMANPIQPNICIKCHTGEWAQGFDATAAITAAGQICTAVR